MPAGYALRTFTIAPNGTNSDVIDMGGARLTGLILPATLVSTNISIYGSVDGVNTFPLYDVFGVPQAVASAVAGRMISIDRPSFQCAIYIQLVTADAQTSGAIITGIVQ
jgi:hypothetical protein